MTLQAVYPQLFDYKNNNVILRYCKDFNKNYEFSAEVFENLKIWLFLCRECSKKNIEAILSESIVEIDNMWHTFLLFTKDYENFCKTFFNIFLHHIPKTDDVPVLPDNIRRENLKNYLELLVANFGEGLMNTWYVEKKYGNKQG